MVTGIAALALPLTSVPGHATTQSAVAGQAHRPTSAESASAVTRRAEVTDVREVLNRRSAQVNFRKGEDGVAFSVAPNARWAGSIWIPWVGNEGEMWKSIVISWGGTNRYWVFQDYWNSTNLVRYSRTNSYQNSVPIPGSNTGGGRRTLVVQSDGSLYLQHSG